MSADAGRAASGADSFPEIHYIKQMGLTDNDFYRLLGPAMGDTPYKIQGRRVLGQLDGGQVEILLGPQQVRKIALFELPFADVSFTFTGVSVERQQRFTEYFDLRFQRGGG